MRLAWAALAALAGLGAQAADDAGLELGRRVFTQLAQPACALCHALEAAGAAGTIGPSLDELDPDAERVLKAVRDGIGAMPAYEERLTPEQLQAVAGYVAVVAGGVSGARTAAPRARIATCHGSDHGAERHGSGREDPHATAACGDRGSR